MIVTLHGFMGAPWRLTDAPHLALTMPFHGLPPAHAHCTRWSEALDALEAQLPAGPITLLGYSLGARLALGLAHRCPRITRAVLVSVHAGLEDHARPERAAFESRVAGQLETGNLPAFVDAWEELPLFATQTRAQRAAQRAHRESHDPAALTGAFRVLGTSLMPSYETTLPALQTPLLFVAGALDSAYATLARRYAQAAAHGSAVVLPDVGHNPIVEAPEALQACMHEFLEAA